MKEKEPSIDPKDSPLQEFWKRSFDLMEEYRKKGDEKAAQGVVACRILINSIYGAHPKNEEK